MRRGQAAESVDAYIEQFAPRVRKVLRGLRATIRAAAPHASEKISYQMPTFYQNGNLVHFAAYEKHIGFYPAPSAITAFAKELRAYRTSKGAVQFPLDAALPLKLIAKIVKFRVAENTAKG